MRRSGGAHSGLPAVPTPKPAKDELPLALRYARPLVQNGHGPAFRQDDFDDRASRRVRDSIFRKVPNCSRQGLRIGLYPHWLFGTAQGESFALRQRQRCDEFCHLSADASQVGEIGGIGRECLQLGDVEELVDHADHAGNVLAQGFSQLLIR